MGGEGGYIRLKRGVGMCGIGKAIATVECQKVSGPTSAPLTTAKPCVDKYSNCAELAKTNCKAHGESCANSCGSLATNYCYRFGSSCCMSCGLGEGMTPAASNTCYDTYSNCASLCGSSYASLCKKACGLC